jgi:preprotein translocase subunit SecE
MNYLTLIVLFVVALVAFAILWRKGSFLQLSAFFRETQEELRKCTWPTWEELTGSTTVVIVAVGILGGFTMGVDYLVTLLMHAIV